MWVKDKETKTRTYKNSTKKKFTNRIRKDLKKILCFCIDVYKIYVADVIEKLTVCLMKKHDE